MSDSTRDKDDRLFAEAMATLGVNKPKNARKAQVPQEDNDEDFIRAMAMGSGAPNRAATKSASATTHERPHARHIDLSDEDAVFAAAMGEGTVDAPHMTPDQEMPGLDSELVRAHVGTPRALRRRIKQGVIDAQDELDLHGLTKTEAFGVVDRFLRDSIAQGLAVVRVITGRGLHSAETAVLKEAMAQWSRGPLQGYAYATCTAPVSHGGEGVTYVFLRRFARS